MDRILADIEAMNAEIRQLHQQLHDTASSRDLHERLSASAAEKAEQVAAESRRRFRTALTVVVVGLLIWTPVVAYSAVWLHEKFRNNCETSAIERVLHEPGYCGLFPGTDRHSHKE